MPAADHRTRRYEEAMVQLAELVRRGKFQPGDRLPSERALAARLQVSRATLREALRAMQLQGLVTSRLGAGTFIANGRAEDLALALDHLALNDIVELRMLVEPSIAALAAERATPQDIIGLQQAVQQQAWRVEQNQSTARADVAFHSTLAEATHNHALVLLAARLMEVLSPSRDESLQTPRRARLSLKSHRRILESIEAHAPDAARQAMEEHIRLVDAALFGLPAGSVPVPSLLPVGTAATEEALHLRGDRV